MLPCLPQNDVNLTSPPLPVTCTGTVGSLTISSAFENAPFRIDDYIRPEDSTCQVPGLPFVATGIPNGTGLPGGCTRDLVHRFYNEQYQIHDGQQDRYVAGSDAVGLTMGTYATTDLPIYRYLHSAEAPHYAIADHFFQAAFGGSFLNHQWLIAAATPTWPGAVADGTANDLHSIVGPDGFPAGTPLHPATPGTKDAQLTQAANPDGTCKVPASGPTAPPGTVCGDYAINTIQPFYQPYAPGTALARRLPPQTAPTIGNRLSDAGVDWAWYAGGWSNAAGDVGAPGWTNGTTPGTCTDPDTVAGAVYPNCADKLFQFHHQPFAYFADYAPGTSARPRTCATSRSSSPQLRAVTSNRSASSSRSAPRTSTPATPASTPAAATSSTCSGRSRTAPTPTARSSSSPTTSTAASGTTSHPRTASTASATAGSRHPHPGAARLAGAQAPLRRGQDRARHHLDPGHDRAPLRAPATDQPRRRRD